MVGEKLPSEKPVFTKTGSAKRPTSNGVSRTSHARPPVEIVWAKQELDRLTREMNAIEVEVRIPLLDQGEEICADSRDVDPGVIREFRQLRKRRRKLVRWLIGVGVTVSAEDEELAKPVVRSKPNRKERTKNPAGRQSRTTKRDAEVRIGTKSKELRTPLSDGRRRRARFVR